LQKPFLKNLNILKRQSSYGYLRIDEKFVKDSIITNGKVDFDRSHAQKKPCPDYLLYPEKNPSYEITLKM
jgi:hypothetical protein